MTKQEIIELARKSDLHCHVSLKQEHGLVIEDLMYFANLVAAKERERCAQMAVACSYMSENFNALAEEIRSLK